MTVAQAAGDRNSATQSGPTESYYGRPIVKEPVWTWEIATYFFTGGLAGASATLGWAADAAGNRPLARSAWSVALAGVAVSPALLIADLGRPERFLNMLRMVKLTSPMSVGSWILTGAGAVFTTAFLRARLDRRPRLGALGGALGGTVLGPALSTYTAVLVADTAIPAWYEARRQLPFVFAGSSVGVAGAAACILTPPVVAGCRRGRRRSPWCSRARCASALPSTTLAFSRRGTRRRRLVLSVPRLQATRPTR
jgi:formate-dependent nitrite reductase membrane component NrfD